MNLQYVVECIHANKQRSLIVISLVYQVFINHCQTELERKKHLEYRQQKQKEVQYREDTKNLVNGGGGRADRTEATQLSQPQVDEE